jgi:NTE family protein
MRFALLLGGGGSVGIAWENGVLAGLQDSIGLDPCDAAVIVGTSAGSAVGADMALGKDPHDALALDADAGQLRPTLDPPDLESGPFAEIINLMMSPEPRTPESAARIGRLAIEADTALSEDQFTAMFRQTVGTDVWPTVSFGATSTCCSTGEPIVWTADDGVDLSLAVASSCAVPGFFPPVRIGDEYYMDGFRGSDYHASIVEPLELDAAIYIGPKIAAVPGVVQMLQKDMDAISAQGVRVHTMLGSEQLDAAGLNLMDFSARPAAFDIGLDDGAEQSAAIAELLGLA